MPSASDSEYVGGAQSTSGHVINMNADGGRHGQTPAECEFGVSSALDICARAIWVFNTLLLLCILRRCSLFISTIRALKCAGFGRR